MATVHIDVMINSTSSQLPAQNELEQWAAAAVGQHFQEQRQEAEISLLIVDEEEGAELNRQWRGKEGPTNVLSFPADLPAELELPLLGDLIICVPVVEQEAIEQKKSLSSHWAHMMVHGTLHLLGYDHIDDQEAEEMESLETEILAQLGYPDPYRDSE
ncbi:rRNA maturation RNase YbeY [Endozoicomonas sp. SCSIO W0465]|uniref:rRNA maturation RNase YbeY n=1 Tax=Endozoicomonas sp. SCSIO W0465 TaxID=2918516 RepID=UPI0020752387|nr:rRNA maturation RNase YbeY [Endozoicomonas sp. SCSIO W0465]USE38358.1 rRNA maturation RNase YbeY [Endozoicomonas sp. SCSIO W0465]